MGLFDSLFSSSSKNEAKLPDYAKKMGWMLSDQAKLAMDQRPEQAVPGFSADTQRGMDTLRHWSVNDPYFGQNDTAQSYLTGLFTGEGPASWNEPLVQAQMGDFDRNAAMQSAQRGRDFANRGAFGSRRGLAEFENQRQVGSDRFRLGQQLREDQIQNRMSAATTLDQLAGTARTNRFQDAGTMLQVGQLQDQLNQQRADIPWERLQAIAAALHGIPHGGKTTTTESPVKMAIGTGMAVAGMRKDGGLVPGYADGGTVARPSWYELLNPYHPYWNRPPGYDPLTELSGQSAAAAQDMTGQVLPIPPPELAPGEARAEALSGNQTAPDPWAGAYRDPWAPLNNRPAPPPAPPPLDRNVAQAERLNANQGVGVPWPMELPPAPAAAAPAPAALDRNTARAEAMSANQTAPFALPRPAAPPLAEALATTPNPVQQVWDWVNNAAAPGNSVEQAVNKVVDAVTGDRGAPPTATAQPAPGTPPPAPGMPPQDAGAASGPGRLQRMPVPAEKPPLPPTERGGPGRTPTAVTPFAAAAAPQNPAGIDPARLTGAFRPHVGDSMPLGGAVDPNRELAEPFKAAATGLAPKPDEDDDTWLNRWLENPLTQMGAAMLASRNPSAFGAFGEALLVGGRGAKEKKALKAGAYRWEREQRRKEEDTSARAAANRNLGDYRRWTAETQRLLAQGNIVKAQETIKLGREKLEALKEYYQRASRFMTSDQRANLEMLKGVIKKLNDQMINLTSSPEEKAQLLGQANELLSALGSNINLDTGIDADPEDQAEE